MKYENPVLEVIFAKDVIVTSLGDKNDEGFGNETDY